jgi:tetratricopeptide (TPR) repeat protein
MLLARNLPLADWGWHYGGARFRLAQEFVRLGKTEEAATEFEAYLQTSDSEDWYDESQAWWFLARQATAHGDFKKAALCHERVRVLALDWNLGQVRTGIYPLLTHRVHHQRARALLTVEQVKEALKEIRRCQSFLPGEIGLPINVVPVLEEKGFREDAEQVFRVAYDTYQRVCADYPRCGWAHHNLAWLCVRCGRRLDEALQHAKNVVELDPKNATYLDTLAEIYFQRGDKAQALDLARQCTVLRADQAYYAAQLERIKAGDRKAALPASASTIGRFDEVVLLDKDMSSHGALLKGNALSKGVKGSFNTWGNGYHPDSSQ